MGAGGGRGVGFAKLAHAASETGVGLYKTRRPTALLGGAAAFRPAGACGRLPWLASLAAAPLFKTLRLRLKLRKLFVKSLTKNFYLSPPFQRVRRMAIHSFPGRGMRNLPVWMPASVTVISQVSRTSTRQLPSFWKSRKLGRPKP